MIIEIHPSRLHIRKGKNVKDGAKLHADKKYVFNIDLKDFYPSCKKKEIVKKIYRFSVCIFL